MLERSGFCISLYLDRPLEASDNYTVSQIIKQVYNLVIFQRKKMLITMNFSLNKADQVTVLLCNFPQISFPQSQDIDYLDVLSY